MCATKQLEPRFPAVHTTKQEVVKEFRLLSAKCARTVVVQAISL
uniref:Uncharacterized protein n=1 Tax=Arundo donax TaxID=35708 RepID=A0A0A9C6K8_ARUDO